ncbi:hypothetical protein D3C84_855080 [compost metagenome]
MYPAVAQVTELALSFEMTLLSSLAVPGRCYLKVLRDTYTGGIEDSEVVLSSGFPLLCSLEAPGNCYCGT